MGEAVYLLCERRVCVAREKRLSLCWREECDLLNLCVCVCVCVSALLCSSGEIRRQHDSIKGEAFPGFRVYAFISLSHPSSCTLTRSVVFRLCLFALLPCVSVTAYHFGFFSFTCHFLILLYLLFASLSNPPCLSSR